LFVVPAVTAIAAWPILGAPMGATTVLGLAIAAAGLRLTLTPSDPQQAEIQPVAGDLLPRHGAAHAHPVDTASQSGHHRAA
jgi:drug/metabolite transporter (DMT)-like permease